VEQNREQHRISVLCRAYKITRSGYYGWRKRQHSQRQVQNLHLSARIATIYDANYGIYGSPRVHLVLKAEGVRVGRKRVAGLMRRMGLKGRCGRIYRSQRRVSVKRFFKGIPNRSLEKVTTGPDQIWVGDITYLKAGGQWRYLAVVMDKHSRCIVGWSLGSQKDSRLTLRALNRAVARRRPASGLIFHSDRGIEYGAFVMQRRLEELGMVQSMNRPEAKMTDNALMESFFHSMKAEGVHGRTFPDQQRLAQHVNNYMPFYNNRRIHSALGYVSPLVFEQQFVQNSVST
jgi:putative transposase